MKFEVLKKSHLKRFIVIGVVVVIIISAIILNFTRAKYRTAQSMPLINGIVNYDLADLNAVAVYLQDEGAEDGYTKADTIPTEGYTFNEDASYCTVNGTRDDSINLSYNKDTQSLSVSPLTTKGTKCYLYFDEKPYTCKGSACETIMANMTTIKTRDDFSTTVTDTTTGTIYKSANESQYDDDGEVYYFAGKPSDNWVKFAGFYWRIIRINGDGSIRLIYQGTSANTTGTGTQIGTSAYLETSSTYSDNAYVGYMYTLNQVHGTETPSTIKGTLDNWYKTNIADKGYSSHVDTNAGFCNDRTPSRGSGIGTTYTEYGANNRLVRSKNPSLKCSDKNNDLFTATGSNKGNKKLTYPVGLITADEVAYAGGVFDIDNSSYYLYTGENYWTMSPGDFGGRAGVFWVMSDGVLFSSVNVVNRTGVRPVINIATNVTITGEGTINSPYVVS